MIYHIKRHAKVFIKCYFCYATIKKGFRGIIYVQDNSVNIFGFLYKRVNILKYYFWYKSNKVNKIFKKT